MQKNSVCWGLDIGHSSIKAVKLARSGNEVTVLGYVIEPITVPENGDREESVVAALSALVHREEFGTTPVMASLSGRQVYSKTVNIPIINPKQIERMVELEARQQIPGDFNEIEWDYHLSPAADGVSQDVALFAAKRELITELMSKAKKTGLNLVGISISSLSLYNFVRFDQSFPEDETIVILDVGAENTDLVCYQGDMLWMRTLGTSGTAITNAFMKKFKVSFEEAEVLKRQAGDSKQADRIIKVIEGTLNDLTNEVQRSLGFYKTQNSKAKLDNVVISGSTFRLPGLPEYLADRLRYSINILEDLDKIKVAPGLEREHFLHDLQSLGVAMGLGLQGVGVAKAEVDLMPSDVQLQRILKTKRWAGVAMVAAVGAMLIADFQSISEVKQGNETLLRKIKESYSINTKRQEESRLVLEKAAPQAQTLKAFTPYGAQQGYATGISRAVLGCLQQIVRDKGAIEGPHLDGKEKTKFQALYLRNLTLPDFDPTGPTGPFRPLAGDRKVTLVVSIPTVVRAGEISRLLVDRLKALPVSEELVGVRPDYETWQRNAAAGGEAKEPPKLFADVQALSDVPGEDSYFYIDKAHLNDKQEIESLEVERKMPVVVVTVACIIKGTEAKP